MVAEFQTVVLVQYEHITKYQTVYSCCREPLCCNCKPHPLYCDKGVACVTDLAPSFRFSLVPSPSPHVSGDETISGLSWERGRVSHVVEENMDSMEVTGEQQSELQTKPHPKFVFPHIHDNPVGWGPCAVPEQFKDTPYQP